MHEGRPVRVITHQPIIYWLLSWNFNFVIFNNSNYPAYNIAIESIGTEHFNELENLSRINNLPPLKSIELKARFEDFVEGDYLVADKIVKSRIPEKFKNLILKLSYYDEARNLHTNLIEFSGSEIINKKQR
jgi:hypothetical protein